MISKSQFSPVVNPAGMEKGFATLAVDRQKKTCYYSNDLNLQGINNNVKRQSEMV
jgi:hypothetical protein